MAAQKAPPNAICGNCGIEFHARPSSLLKNKQHYCSRKCFHEALRNGRDIVTIVCDYCGKKVEKRNYNPDNFEFHFCSNECYLNFRKTMPNGGYTDEQRENMRQGALKARGGNPDNYRRYHGKREHRIVAEQMLGRKLKPGEVVHHIDGKKRNNSPDNLMVFANQAEHAKFHKQQKGVVV